MADEIKDVIGKIARYKKGAPLSSFTMTYDAQTNQIEPVYYWILDFMQDMGLDVQKITDNFAAAPGSGQHSEMGQKATRMHEEGMKIMGMINQVIKTVLNLVYDLKEFEIRIEHYDDANSSDTKKKEAGLLALKQIWLDNVDMKRGRGSIHQMSYEMGFTTLREAFMMANNVEDVKKMEIINDQVKRILIPRLSEFLKWKEKSQDELKKRFAIEKSYLKTEVESLKLYTKWARPYLKAAEELRMKGFDKNPALVSAFSTSMFELTLLGKRNLKFDSLVESGELPPSFKNYKPRRDYASCVLISMTYRGHLGQRATQKGDYAYGFGGRVNMTFDSYSLNSEELKLFEKELEKQDIEEGLKFIEENTQVSLDSLKDDLDKYLGDDKKEKEEKKKEDDTNPFSALFGLFKSEKKSKGKNKKDVTTLNEIKKDNYVEEYLRKISGVTAKKTLYTIYDVYKKAHGMASSPEGFDN